MNGGLAKAAPRLAVLTAGCALAAALLYRPACDGGFVWDDRVLILENAAALDEWSDALAAFTRRAIDSPSVSYYRPVLMASYVADRQLWGLSPSAFHTVNVALHAVNGALVLILIYAFTGSLGGAVFGALLFAVHPVQAQAVSLILGRNDLLLVPPVAAMLLSDEAWYRSGRRRWIVLTVAAYAATVWTKETGLLAALLLPAADLLRHRRFELARRLPLYAGIVLVAGAYLLVRIAIIGRVVGDDAYGSAPLLQRALEAVTILGYYLQHVVLPWGFSPTPYHSRLANPAGWPFWRALLVDAGFCGLLLWSLARRPRLGFALLFFLVTLFPVLGLARMKILILEHRLYLPMVGVALAAGELAAGQAAALRSKPAMLAVAGLLSVLALATRERVPIFHDALSLWGAAARATPLSDYAREEYGVALQQAHRDAEAIAEFEAALRITPELATARYSLAFSLEATGQRPQAIIEVESVVAERPGYAQAWNLLGVLRKRDGDLPAAEAALRHGLAVAPGDAALLANLRNVLRLTGREAEARAIDAALAERKPGLASPRSGE